jgi:SAM-dependent methyltransferase
LLPTRIHAATALHPGIHWLTGSAHELPFEARNFDIVMCFTVFSSILDDDAQSRVAAEMRRVRKDGGVIICHDFVYDIPRNSQVRGVRPKAIRRLLGWPGARMDVRRVTLAPPIARRIAPRMEWLASGLERLQVFNTHIVALLY